MRKLIIAALVLGVALFIHTTNVQAQEKYVGGGFEASGHIVTGLGYQHHNNKVQTELANDGDVVSYAGPIGRYLGQATYGAGNRQDNLSFFVDEVELDLMKSFGENVRFRADLDFARTASAGVGIAAFTLEQAYATANIPLGNGIEFLIGRFNTPIGFEAADVADNDLISMSIIRRGLRPVNTTGAKIYYAFSDLVDLHFYVVNTLYGDTLAKINDIPSVGLRLGFNWGEEGTESTIGISPLFGPETQLSNKHFTYGGDLDVNWWITESFALGLEALYVKSADATSITNVNPSTNMWFMAGLLNLHYVFSDVWDGTLRYTFAKQHNFMTNNSAAGNNFNLTGWEQSMHEIALGGAYAVADGAKFKLEGRFDMVKPNPATRATAGFGTEYVYGAVVGFVYDF